MTAIFNLILKILDTKIIDWYNIKKQWRRSMYCKNCGEFVPKNREECPFCGSKDLYVEEKQVETNKKEEKEVKQAKPVQQVQRYDDYRNDYSSFGISLVCFLVPFAALILYMVWKDEYPLKAASASRGGLIALILTIVTTVFLFYEVSGIVAAYYAKLVA